MYPHGKVVDVRKTDFYFFPAAEPEQVVPEIVRLVKVVIPKRFGFHPIDDIQVLTLMQRSDLGPATSIASCSRP